MTSVAVLAAVFFGASYVTASSESLWVNSGTITRTLVAENITSSSSPYFDTFCTRITQKENKYIQFGNSWIRNGYTDVNGCWTSTSYGLFGMTPNGNYLRLSQAGAVTAMDDNNGSYVPLPNSDKLVRRDGIGSSFYWGLSVYDHLDATFTLRTNIGSKDRYAFPNSDHRWVAKDPNTGNNLQINRVDASADGKWLVVEGAGSFFRLNIETKEILAFQAPINLYGYGLNPSYNLAISNDGRYATIAVGGNNSGKFLLYDLSTCVSDPNQIMKPATGCGKRDIRPDAMPGATSNAAPINVEFSSGGESISYNHYENGKMNRYMITAPGQSVHLLEYLAMGDSFSSGEGDSDGGRYYVAGTDGNGQVVNNTGIVDFPYWKEKCHVSTRSYPYLLANEANLNNSQFHSLACSSTKIDGIINTRSDSEDEGRNIGQFEQLKGLSTDTVKEIKYNAINNFIPGRAAQIEFVKKYKPRVSTIGIGGNDIGFADKIKGCIAFGADTCHFATTSRHYTALEIRSLYAKLVNAYTQLKSASPTTRFYAVGYPQIASVDDFCTPNVRLDTFERRFAREVVVYLNQVIRAAANKTGVYYLDIENSLSGSSLCDFNSLLSNAVNGLKMGSDIGINGPSQHFGVVGNESYHPNDLGHTKIAAALGAKLNDNAINIFSPCQQQVLVCWPSDPQQSNVPAIPSYFTEIMPPGAMPANTLESAIVGVGGAVVDGLSAFPKGVELGVDTATGMLDAVFKPLTQVQVKIFSTPTDLGTLPVNADGEVNGNVTLPASIEPGYHTLHLVGILPSGDSVNVYQTIFVYQTLDDLDGDGILNQDDICGIVEPSNVDEDTDGVDDACDGFIGEVETHPLYRVRNGDTAKGEIESRFYIERDVLEAKSKLNIVNDYDSDGDGWALIGHTESDNDGKTQTQFWVDDANVPHLLLDGENSVTCAQLTPISLAVVAQGEDRLLQTEQDNSCSEPESLTVWLPAEEPAQTGGRGSDIHSASTEGLQQALSQSILQVSHLPATSTAVESPVQGYVAGVSTAKVPNYFDGPGKNAADVTGEVTNTFLIGGSVMVAVLLGIVMFVRSMALLGK